MLRRLSLSLLLACGASDILLDGGGGLSWRLLALPATGHGYALGQPLLRGAPLDNLPVTDGIAFWRRMSDALVVPVNGTSVAVDASGAGATLSGAAALPSGGPGGGATDTAVSVRVELDGAFPAASVTVAPLAMMLLPP